MNNILIEIIITNQCNKRCNYCDLDFRDTFIPDINIDLLLNYINSSSNIFFHLNFFGGEPLLGFSKIKKIVNGIKINNIKYSIGTNGNLLNNGILDFFYKNKVVINLSVDNITGFKNIFNIEEKYINIIEINFINDPDFLFKSKKLFSEIIYKGFNKINFMPVFSTKKWSKVKIIELGKILKYIKKNKDINLKLFSYFNGISLEKQFILDTNGYFYNDLDSLFWLQKQYSNLDVLLKEKIEKNTININLIKDDFSFEKLLNNYKIDEIVNLVMEIPKNQGYTRDYLLFDYIFKGGNKKMKGIGM